MSHTHRGSCHCGRIKFEFDGEVKQAIECNCSICRRKGALWHALGAGRLRIVAGEDELGVYRFNTMQAQHYFCPTCGMSPFSHPRLDPAMWVVNLRCVEDVDLGALRRGHFDGEHWEEAAAALVQARAKRGPSPR
jgi:hypothetical protein